MSRMPAFDGRRIDEWIQVTSFGASYIATTPVYYRKDHAGNLHLRGIINVNGSANGATAFTLPSGYRPTLDCRYICDTVPVATLGRVIIGTGGAVNLYLKSGTPATYVIDSPALTLA